MIEATFLDCHLLASQKGRPGASPRPQCLRVGFSRCLGADDGEFQKLCGIIPGLIHNFLQKSDPVSTTLCGKLLVLRQARVR